MRLSVCIITHNEEANIGRTLESVRTIADEIIVVDSHSTDSTVALSQSRGAIVFAEDWKGFAGQKMTPSRNPLAIGYFLLMPMRK